MSVRHSISRLAIAGLLLMAVAATACVSEKSDLPNSTDASPSPSPEVLTAGQVLALAQSAARSVASYRGKGEELFYAVDGVTEANTLTFEWSKPDSVRQESRTTDPAEIQQESSETIRIGDRSYLRRASRDESGSVDIGWHEAAPDSGEPNIVMSSLDIAVPMMMGPVTLNGRQVYVVSGTSFPAAESVSAISEIPANGELVLFIDAANFQLVRTERTAIVFVFRPTADPNSPDGIIMESDRFEFTVSTSFDFEYFDEPISIEPPEL